MDNFAAYSAYYNLLYQDKDYQGETDFIAVLLGKAQGKVHSVLDLGCGTGRHDLLLARKGYAVTGVDRSSEMLKQARSLQGPDLNLHFVHSAIEDLSLSEQFDAVTALFHVLSYQTSNAQVETFFRVAEKHLRPGGVFVFDFWYGPAVLTQRPEVRVKEVQDDQVAVLRVARPTLDTEANLVDVRYTIWIKDQDSKQVLELEEVHRMRYFFLPEVEHFCEQCGFTIIQSGEWLTEDAPSPASWGVYLVVQK